MTSLDIPKPRRPVTRLVSGSLALLTGTSLALFWAKSHVSAQSAATAVTYTETQAEQGRIAYEQQCASCHGANLDDGAYGPPLTGTDFRQKWGARSLDALMTYTSERMPPTQPGTLGAVRYAQVIAFLLQENGVKPGGSELPADPTVLASKAPPSWPPAGGGGLAPAVTIPPAPPRTNPLDSLQPVTDAMLTRPAEGDWLLWRRTYDASGLVTAKWIQPGDTDRP